MLIVLLWVWGWAGEFFHNWYFWHCILHSDKPMDDANKPHDTFLTRSFNGVSWGVWVPEMWQGRHRGMLWWKEGGHFSQDPASCLKHSSCVGPVLQTRTVTRVVKCPCSQWMGSVVLQACAEEEKQGAVFGRWSWICQAVQLWPCSLQGVVLWQLVPETRLLNHTAGRAKQAHLTCQEWHSILHPLVDFYLLVFQQVK